MLYGISCLWIKHYISLGLCCWLRGPEGMKGNANLFRIGVYILLGMNLKPF